MTLTIFVVCPVELDSEYLRLYREALLRWNREGLADTQVILLPQEKLSVPTDPFEVVETDFEMVDGYPVWDAMKSVRQAWPLVRGEYVTFDHPEFLWGRNRLDKTIAWLNALRPICALGNLRRPGDALDGVQGKGRDDISQKPSAWLRGFLDRGEWDAAALALEYLQTSDWMYWAVPRQKPGPSPWIEDVFYADKEWLDLWGFARYDMELPFQDVYDLMQMAARKFYEYGVPCQYVRAPQHINKLVHLWHSRAWGSWTPEMRNWFLSQPERWARTRFLDRSIWDRLIDFKRNPKDECEPVSALRFGARGTANRYGIAVANWLDDVGVEVMKAYYAERKERGLR
jgi:hypothetical protein